MNTEHVKSDQNWTKPTLSLPNSPLSFPTGRLSNNRIPRFPELVAHFQFSLFLSLPPISGIPAAAVAIASGTYFSGSRPSRHDRVSFGNTSFSLIPPARRLHYLPTIRRQPEQPNRLTRNPPGESRSTSISTDPLPSSLPSHPFSPADSTSVFTFHLPHPPVLSAGRGDILSLHSRIVSIHQFNLSQMCHPKNGLQVPTGASRVS